jgi:Domain of unknown function (DUF4412)
MPPQVGCQAILAAIPRSQRRPVSPGDSVACAERGCRGQGFWVLLCAAGFRTAMEGEMRLATLTAAAGLTLMPGLALAGVVYEVETKDYRSTPAHVDTNRTKAEGRLLKMGIDAKKPGSKGEVIYRGDRREMLIVDHQTNSYFALDAKTSAASSGGQMGGAPAANGTTVRKTTERADKAGYPCVKHEVMRGGQVIRELWVTDWANVPGADEFREVAVEAAQFYKSAVPGATVVDMGILDDLTNIDGFPVATRTFKNGAVEKESALSTATKRALGPDDFEPPAGYRRRDMMVR